MYLVAPIAYESYFKDTIEPFVIPTTIDSIKTKQYASEFIKYIFMSASEEDDAFTPISCPCGFLTKRANIGLICPDCHKPVVEPPHDTLSFHSWLEIPEHLPPIMAPGVYRTLQAWMSSHAGSKLLDIFLGKPDKKLPPILAARFETGSTYFYENFDEIMHFLLYEYSPLKITKIKRKDNSVKINEKSQDVEDYLKLYRDEIFSRHFPILNKALHMITNKGTLKLQDETVDHILSMATNIATSHLTHRLAAEDDKAMDIAAFNIQQDYSAYSNVTLKDRTINKLGLVTKQILGSATHFSFRAVVSQAVAGLPPDEILFPWRLGVRQLKLEILNKLIRSRRYSYRQATQKHHLALEAYDEDIDVIFRELIVECPFKGLPATIGRNPSMIREAIQAVAVTGIKTDILDDTISHHQLIMTGPNMDCDGDTAWGTMLKEMSRVQEFMHLHPAASLLSSEELAIAPMLKFSSEVAVNTQGWLLDGRECR